MATMMSQTTDSSKSSVKSVSTGIDTTPKGVSNETLLTTSTKSSITSSTISSSTSALLTKTPNTPWYLNRKARNNNNSDSSNSSNNCNTSNNNNNNNNSNTNNNTNNNQAKIPTPNQNVNETNFLPIGQQTYFPNTVNPQNIALASVQSQLQPGSVVFTSPTVAMATLTGTAPPGTVQQNGASSHPQQQIVVTPVTPTGQIAQPITGTFQTNGQTHQFIQTPGMNMVGGLPQVQLIGANGQPYFPYPVQMQPLLTMTIPQQSPGQNITIIPTNQNSNGSTVITTTPMTQVANPTTPVKNTNNQTTIVKGVTPTVSQQQQHPQQQAKNNSNVAGKSNPATPTTPQANMQQTATFQQSPNNQTFLIGIPQSTTSQNGTTTLLQTTPTNARKSMSGPQMIHKIQSSTQPILTQAQFKPNPSFSSPNSSGSPNQTIMVQGQGIPTGGGSIQITNTPTILSSFNPSYQTIQPSIVNFSPQLNQQPMTALTQNGQIVQIRTQNSNDSPQMYIQTSSPQFQAVPVQMTSGNQPQTQNNASMHMTQAGQPIMTSPLNHQMPISIKTNHNQGTKISSTTMITNSSQSNNIANITTPKTSNITTSTTMVSTANRQRPLRPASSPQQSSISTQTTATKPKTVESNRTSGTNVPKLAPKASTIVMVSSSNSIPKLPLPPLPKTSENNSTVVSNSVANGNSNMNKTSNAKMNTSTQSVSSSTLQVQVQTTVGLKVNNANNTVALSKSDSNNKSINKKTEKKDAASCTENTKVSITIPAVSSSTKSLKNNPNVLRNNTTINNTNNSSNSHNISNSTNTKTPNGVLSSSQSTNGSIQANSNISTPINSNNQPQNQLSKNTNINNVPNGLPAKSTSSNNPNPPPNPSSNSSSKKNKKYKRNSDCFLTHLIDGEIVYESVLPFPVGVHLIKNEIEDSDDEKDNNFVSYLNAITYKKEEESNVEIKKENDFKNKSSNIDTNDEKDSIAIKSKENKMKNSSQQQQNDHNSESNSNSNNSMETSQVQQQKSLNQQSTQQSIQQQPIPPAQQQQQPVLPSPQFNLEVCLQCRKSARIKDSDNKKWNKYCLTCAEKLFLKQQSMTTFDSESPISTQYSASPSPPVGIGAHKASIPTTTAPSSAANVVVDGINGAPLTQNHQSNQIPCTSSTTTTSANTGATTNNNNSNGIVNNMKRPLNQVTATDDLPQFAKKPRPNDMRQTMPSNLNGNSQATISNGHNNNQEISNMWLPEGGTKHPENWKDQDVYQFLIHMEGCPAYVANNFLAQEVDGKAMLLVNEGHVIDWGQTKLGPALKICQKIKELKALFDC